MEPGKGIRTAVCRPRPVSGPYSRTSLLSPSVASIHLTGHLGEIVLHVECFRAGVWFDRAVGNARASSTVVGRPRSRHFLPVAQGADQRTWDGKPRAWTIRRRSGAASDGLFSFAGAPSHDQLPRHACIPHRARVRAHHHARQHTCVPGRHRVIARRR